MIDSARVTELLRPLLRDIEESGGPADAAVAEPGPDGEPGVAMEGGRFWIGDVDDWSVAEVQQRLVDGVHEQLLDLVVLGSSWPPCPRHPGTHPMWAEVGADAVWWTCPRDHQPVEPVGGLALDRDESGAVDGS